MATNVGLVATTVSKIFHKMISLPKCPLLDLLLDDFEIVLILSTAATRYWCIVGHYNRFSSYLFKFQMVRSIMLDQ